MRIYTKTGDQGETGLIGGKRISKDHLRVEAYGTVDELNSAIGIVRTHLDDPEMDDWLKMIQNSLFIVGTLMANPPERADQFAPITPEHVKALEQIIDQLESELPPLRQFILPGGTIQAAFLHQARCICRRAERRVITLHHKEAVNPDILRYLNRLSDLLFVMARAANHRSGVEDVIREVSEPE